MILVHYFTRDVKRKTYLMADSSATRGSSPLWPTAEVMFEVDPSENPDRWQERARKRVMDAFPKLVYVRTFVPKRRRDKAQVFDMTFKEEKEVPLKRKILRKIGLSK